jgi:uncharacterized glyoxalase superfamily protein PhnB
MRRYRQCEARGQDHARSVRHQRHYRDGVRRLARGETQFAGFSLSINTQTEAEVDHLIKALGDGGEIRMQPEKTFFAKRFGEVVDRFGIDWLVICE